MKEGCSIVSYATSLHAIFLRNRGILRHLGLGLGLGLGRAGEPHQLIWGRFGLLVSSGAIWRPSGVWVWVRVWVWDGLESPTS